MARASSSFAEFEQVLFYLDGPQLITLAAGQKSKIVAIATNNIAHRGFFGAKVSLKQFSEYLNERFDLRFLLSNADRAVWYEFDLPEVMGSRVELTEIDLTDDFTQRILPDHGLFARDHTHEYQAAEFETRSVQRFAVDGNWDMREFSKFHTSISDLYALTRSIDVFLDDQASMDRKRKVMQSFVKPWEGGGSYFGFFRSLAKTGGRDYRPDIQAIQWASPGYIDINGDQDSFDRLLRLVDHYASAEEEIGDDYEHLWSYLQEAKLLKKSSKGLDRQSGVYVEVGERAKALSRSLGVTQYRSLKKMAGNDALVAAKVLLATKRRLDRLYSFFEQGRLAVSTDQVQARPSVSTAS